MNPLFDLIEQGAYKQALALLTGDNLFSQDELNECLMSACRHKHTLIVQMLVQQGSNVNYQDTNGNTPLLISVERNVKDIVQFLLTNRANVNTCNAVGDSALILSLYSGSTEVTEILLKQKGVSINHQNQDGYTAIMKAVEVKNFDALKLLLDEYFNVKTIEERRTQLINEIRTQYEMYELINEHQTHELINEHKTYEHKKHELEEEHKTHELIYEHKTHELILTLRETINCRGENVHQIAERRFQTTENMNPLFDLIEQGAYKQALALLTGDNLFSQDELNECLMSACRHKHTLIVQMLVQQGSNVNYQDTNGNTPLLISVERNVKDIVQFLLTNRANVNTCNAVGDSALILSLYSGSTEVTEVLLKQKGVSINHQNQDGYTAIMKAVEVKNFDAFKLLLDEYFNVKTIEERRTQLINEIRTQYEMYELINEHQTHKLINEHKKHELEEEHKTHELIYEHKTHELILTLRETINCRGENVHQIAERCGIGSVFQLLNEQGITQMSPLELAMRTNDITSFNIFLNSDFLHATERKKYLDVLFFKIFIEYSDFRIIDFKENEIAMMKALLEHGVDVNTTWRDHIPLSDSELVRIHSLEGRSSRYGSIERSYCYERQPDPIQIAAKSGCLKVLQLLLTHKADVNRYKFPSSPLHIALSHGHTECAKLLIQRGAHVDFNQVLQLAVDQQEPKYVCFLIQNYRNDILKHIEGTSKIEDVLLSSVRMGSLEIIGQILDLGADIDGVVGSGMCLLAESNNGDVAKYLIDRGADVNIKCQRENSDTPLIRVLLNRDKIDNSLIEVIQVLLENGASANDRSLNGKTALMLAAMKEGNMSVIQLLLDHGAGLCERDRESNTALIHAALAGCVKNVTFLIKCSKDREELLNAQNDEGLTALMCARKQTMIKELIDQGADVHIKDTDGNTCLLHLLISPTEVEGKRLKYLIRAGCDVNHQNNHGLSPLMVAARKCCKKMMSELLKSGAEINAVSKTDNTITALTHLSYRPRLDHDYFDCVEYLLDRGANSSYLATSALHNMIVGSKLHLVPKLIRCGLGPADILVSDVLSSNNTNNITFYRISRLAKITSHCSPLCTSLFVGNSALARFFVENLFLTTSDVYLLGHNKLMRCHLATKNYKECLDILSEITTQPMTLFNLSFLVVSTAAGATQGRGTMVNMLPIPQIIKNKLLFKEQDVVPTEVVIRTGYPGMPSISAVNIFNTRSLIRCRY